MGSPEFARPALQKLSQVCSIVGVVTQPDRPGGRGKNMIQPPVKTLALSLGLDVFQPEKLKEESAFTRLLEWKPDLIVVAAYGQILRENVLGLPFYGCINIHASLLPRWRGAAPIQAAILHGDQEIGISIMKMEKGVDTGPILSQRKIQQNRLDTYGTLSLRMAEEGAALLIDTLPGYLDSKIELQKQNDELATYAPMIKKEDGKLDLNQPAEELLRHVRAFAPWPGAFTMWQDSVLKIHRADLAAGKDARPGVRSVIDKYPALGTAKDWLVLNEVQLAGKKAMPGDTFLMGARNW